MPMHWLGSQYRYRVEPSRRRMIAAQGGHNTFTLSLTTSTVFDGHVSRKLGRKPHPHPLLSIFPFRLLTFDTMLRVLWRSVAWATLSMAPSLKRINREMQNHKLRCPLSTVAASCLKSQTFLVPPDCRDARYPSEKKCETAISCYNNTDIPLNYGIDKNWREPLVRDLTHLILPMVANQSPFDFGGLKTPWWKVNSWILSIQHLLPHSQDSW